VPAILPACAAPALEAGTIKCLRLGALCGVVVAMRTAIETELGELRSRNARRLGALIHVVLS
jgi:hypothetical protein